MRFQTALFVIVWLFLYMVALEKWGEAAEGSAPRWLRPPDTIPENAILWEGVALPLEEAQLREVTERARRREAELREATERARRREAELRETRFRRIGPAQPTLTETQRWEAELREATQETQRREAELKVATQEAQQWEAVSTQRRSGLVPVYARSRPAQPLDLHALPVVSIGRPEIWRLTELYPPENMPPLMQAHLKAADFYLIRLFCSFRPVPGRSRVGWARFHVLLRPDHLGRQPIAYDISPVDITQEVKRHLKVTVAPTLKFQAVEAEVGSVEFGLEYPELQPIIVGAGVGETIPTWDYQLATGIDGIQGAKWMHLLVKAPKGMPAATAELALTAQIYVDSWLPSWIGPATDVARLEVPLWPSPSFP